MNTKASCACRRVQLTLVAARHARVRQRCRRYRCAGAVTGRDAGQTGNELAAVPDTLHQRTWLFLMQRLGTIPRVPYDVRGGLPGPELRQHGFRPRGQRDGLLDPGGVQLDQHAMGPDAGGQRRRADRAAAPRRQGVPDQAKCSPVSHRAAAHRPEIPQRGGAPGRARASATVPTAKTTSAGSARPGTQAQVPVPHAAAAQRGAHRAVRA